MPRFHNVLTPAKTISLFVLRIVVIYSLLMIPWPGLTQAYHSLYCKAGNAMFYRFGDSCRVTFSPLEQRTSGKDTELLLDIRHPKRGRAGGKLKIDAMYLGYKPTIFLMALILATPIPWSRRWRSLVWGLVMVNAFIAFRVWIQLMATLSNPKALSLYELPTWVYAILSGTARVLLQSPATSYIVPVFIWGLVAIRFDDISKIFPAMKKRLPNPAKS